jgi:acetyltransferase-like isoleucine patch superfamily enzyme
MRIGSRGRLAVIRSAGDRLRRISKTAAVYPGTQLGADVEIGDFAVLGKQPTLGKHSTAPREELAPLTIGDGVCILAGAVVFAGTRLGQGVIVGDQACVRERCDVADDVIIGRGAFVENDVAIGPRTKIQANAYVTAYSTLEEDVFIAPCVITANDNFMGRTERRHKERLGPTIRRGARIGAGAILLPGIEIGEEAFVGAGAVVLHDVPPRAVVVGNPARRIRDVADDELLGA